MNKSQNYILEPISHKTNQHSYSFHNISFHAKEPIALYAHWHTELEFFYLTQGQISFFIEENEFLLHPGDLLFIPSGLYHYAKNNAGISGSFKALVISADEIISPLSAAAYQKYISPVSQNLPIQPVLINENSAPGKQIIHHFLNLFLINREQLSENELMIAGNILILWQQMYNHYLSKSIKDTTSIKTKEQIQPALDLIQNSYQEAISLDTLAKSCNLSVGQFIRSFKKYTKVTPFVYLNHYRIMKSCTLLKDTSVSISSIAVDCGFNNLSYFNREFKKLMNITPSEYRKK